MKNNNSLIKLTGLLIALPICLATAFADPAALKYTDIIQSGGTSVAAGTDPIIASEPVLRSYVREGSRDWVDGTGELDFASQQNSTAENGGVPHRHAFYDNVSGIQTTDAGGLFDGTLITSRVNSPVYLGWRSSAAVQAVAMYEITEPCTFIFDYDFAAQGSGGKWSVRIKVDPVREDTSLPVRSNYVNFLRPSHKAAEQEKEGTYQRQLVPGERVTVRFSCGVNSGPTPWIEDEGSADGTASWAFLPQ